MSATPTDPSTQESGHRRVVANIALSLDGRTSGPGGDHDMSWMVPHALSDQARDHMAALLPEATTALLGRKNFEGFGGFWPAVADAPDADPRDRAFSAWLNASDKVVLTSTLSETGWANTRFVDAAATEVTDELRRQPGGDILVLASGSVIKDLLAADQVDRLSITLCPEISGGGGRLFDDGLPTTSWTLVSAVPTTSGALCLTYDRAAQR